MKLKNSLLDKIQNENVLHSSTKEEFNQVESIIAKLRKDNQYWSLFNQIRQLIRNDNYDDLQKASELLAEREFSYVNSFRNSTQTILEPNNNNGHQSEKTTFLNYLKKQLYFQDNFDEVKKHYELHSKYILLGNQIKSFDKSNNRLFLSIISGIITLSILIILYLIHSFNISNGQGFNLIGLVGIIFLLSLFYTLYCLAKLFFSKDGWRSISDYNTNKKNKKEYNNLKVKLTRLKSEINTVANNGYRQLGRN